MKRLTAALTLLLLASGAGIAFGSVTARSGSYSGHFAISATETVSFTVKNSEVINLRVGVFPPNRCGSGGPGPKQHSSPAKIHGGSFRATVFYAIGKGVDTADVTGTFLSGGKEQGFVTSGKGITKKCSVHDRYTTKHS